MDGAQQIWEKLARKHNIEVILNTEITEILRKKGVKIITKEKTYTFDQLIYACKPKDILSVLDATEEEKDLFSKVITEDYRTYEVAIAGLREGEIAIGGFMPTIYNNIKNRPTGYIKKYADRNVFVLYVNATRDATDELIVKNIKAELKKIGATFEKLLSKNHWAYFPHVDKEALDDNFYEKLHALQGKTTHKAQALSFLLIPWRMSWIIQTIW